jgi:hypothetical protein
MSADYVLLCGVMWVQFASQDAGLELGRALHSEDPKIVSLACVLLDDATACA